MSSEQTFSTSDLRSTAQDYKRDAAHKHKWHLGAVEVVGRGAGNPRPFKASETHYNLVRRSNKRHIASTAHGAKMARKRDAAQALDAAISLPTSDDSTSSSSDVEDGYVDGASPALPPPDAGIMYSFDAPRGPTEGSQILNVALNKAMAKFEEKETVKLVREEYEVVDSEGERVGLSPVKSKGKGKGKEGVVVVDVGDEDEYEFV